MKTLSDKRVKARKEHVCDFCRKKISIGEKYRYSTHTFDGEIYGWHSCDRCKGYVTKAFEELGNSIDVGLTQEMFMEFMYEHYSEVVQEWWS